MHQGNCILFQVGEDRMDRQTRFHNIPIGFIYFIAILIVVFILQGNTRQSYSWDEEYLPRWRFFSTTDGFREAWMYAVTAGPSSPDGVIRTISIY
jgi:hypothetical protein